MLGWFKKKFKKQDAATPQEEANIEEQSTDISVDMSEQPASDDKSTVEAPPPGLQEQEENESITPSTEPVEQDVDTEEIKPVEPLVPTSAEVPDEAETVTVAPEPQETPEVELRPLPTPEAKPTTEEPIKAYSPPEPRKDAGKKKKSLFSRLTEKLGKTRETFTYQLDALFLGKKEIDTEMLDELEEILITADLGVGTTQELLENARRKVKRKELYDPQSLKKTLKVQIKKLINENEQDATLVMPSKGPFVIMVIGVNGVGKTTTIGKIAKKFQMSGSSVMLVAADTFRAAAVSQLKIWGERSNIPVIAHKDGADPSSVVFDALGIAQSKNIDVVLVDTAGRMHTKDNLMEELKKIKRVMGKKLKGAPHEIMLVIDATTGQNGISQARLFDDAVGVTGITLTKLDGTSKGGIVANICKELQIPIRFIGIGEKMDDLRDFNADEFVDALFHSSADQPH